MKVGRPRKEDAEGKQVTEKWIYHRDTEGTEFRKNSKSDPIPKLCVLCVSVVNFLFSASFLPSATLSSDLDFAAGKQLGKELPVVTDSNSTIGEMYVFRYEYLFIPRRFDEVVTSSGSTA
jgi:hypothetical protein